MSAILENWFSQFTFGKVQAHKNLTFLPISSSNGQDFEFLTLSKAMKERLVDVKEIDEEAIVGEVRVTNKSHKYILIIDGDHLVGAKQNRIVNKTIIISPETEVVIPVSCTEEGRWRYESHDFKTSAYSPPSAIRRILKKEGHVQHEVWSDIAERLSSLKVGSPTSSLEEAFIDSDSSIEEYKNSISIAPNQVGFMIYINGEFSGLDIFGDKHMYKEQHNNLIGGYIMDAIHTARARKEKTNKESANKIIDAIIHSNLKYGKSVGAEKRRVIKGSDIVGELTTFRKKPVHLSVFPGAIYT